MWTKDSVFQDDINNVSNVDFIKWDELKDSKILITGGTGLIGSTFIKALIVASQKHQLNIKIIALVRDKGRAFEKFKDELKQYNSLELVIGSVESLPLINCNIDYIIHGASSTSSKDFVNKPVEVIDTALKGTKNLLELAKVKKVKGFVYLSSMEVYGYPEKGHKVSENEIGSLTPLDVRNSYPISKQMCEALCVSYSKEYQVPARIIRLTQTFGPGINYNDNRIFAYFARCVVEKKDIVLKTKGETERCYLYTSDAVTAILAVLLNGKNGQAYNAADEGTYCSIAEMAEKVAKDGGIKVTYDIEDESVNGFPKTLFMDLDTSLLKSLGWKVCGGGVQHK